MFYVGPTSRQLQAGGIKTLMLAGMSACGVVLSAARDAHGVTIA
jgi:hypothetical protein